MTEKTERVQLLNLTFPKLTPIPIHNVDLILHYLLGEEQAGLIIILYTF